MKIMEGTHTVVRVSLATKLVTHQSNINQRDDHSDVDIQADAKPGEEGHDKKPPDTPFKGSEDPCRFVRYLRMEMYS